MKKLNQATSAQIIEANKETPIILVLKKKTPKKSVTWDGSVVDNEFMNKKKSNKCCIYHKPRRWDESDTDESSSEAPDPIKHKAKPNTNTCTQTQTQTITQTDTNDEAKQEKHVRWDPNTIDNEFMNKKKSNKCCIYHKPRRWDESDTESDSSSDYHRDPNYTKPDVQAINDAANTGTTASTQTDPQVTSTQAKSDLEK
eukprot:145324_1